MEIMPPSDPSIRRYLLALLRDDASSPPAAMRGWSAEAWHALTAEAARQGLGPLLYHRALGGSWLVPTETLAAWRKQYLRTAAANARRFAALEGILEALQTLDIPVLLLKGAHLAPWVYKNIALRPMADLDLLIHQEDLSRALQALTARGYAPLEGEAWMGSSFGHYALRHPEGILLELHHRIGVMGIKAHIDQEGIWRRARPVTLEGQRAWLMEPIDLALYLCAHAASQHLFGMGILPLYDLRQVFACYGAEIVPQTLAERAKAWRIARGTYLTLRLAQELLGASIPSAILERLAPPEGERYAQRAVALVLSKNPAQTPSSNLVAFWAEHSWAARLRLLGRILVPPAERLRSLYGLPPNRPLSPLLYLRRWMDLLLHRRVSAKQFMGHGQETAAWQALIQWLARG